MHIAAAAAAVVVTTGCLDPLVKDTPGASSHLLPPGTQIPSAADDPELANQIGLNDGLDDRAVAMSGGVIPRGAGMSAGLPVRFWSFGPATRAPSPIYEFFEQTESGLQRIAHPPLLDALPGDPGYSPLHGINQVVVTGAYAGELITTMDALADAIDLGLVEEPVPIKMFVDSPVVLPTTRLEVGGADPQAPEIMFARGYTVNAFELGGALGIQPTGPLVLPTSQVSFVREVLKGSYDATRPIFQAAIPTMPPPPMVTTYTPLSVVVNVDLAPGFQAALINQDSDLFVRSASGAIIGTTPAVAQFVITTSLLLLQLQFTDGMP